MCERNESLAWAAGFFDGEGSTCVMRGKGRNGWGICLTIQQNNRSTLERFAAIIGGDPPIYGPYVYKMKKVNPRYDLRIYGLDRVNKALGLLWPWLGDEKREQAHRARETYAHRPLASRPDRNELGQFLPGID